MSDSGTRSLVLDEVSPIKIIQVAGTTPPGALAGSIAEEYRQAMEVAHNTFGWDGATKRMPNISLHAIGHQAVGQAIKAVAIANGHLAAKGILFTLLPSFEDKQIPVKSGSTTMEVRTIMRLRLVVWQVGG